MPSPAFVAVRYSVPDTLSAVDLKSGKRVRQMPIGTVVPLSSTPAVLISLRIAAMTSSPARYRNRSKHQGPGRGPDGWQRMRFCNLPGGATLARAYPEQRLRGPAGTAFARTCREQRLRGLPEQCFCRSGQASAATRRKPAQSLNHFISAPDEVLMTGNACAFAICPAALRLHGPTRTTLTRSCRNSACTGLPRTTLTRTTGAALL